MDFWNGWLVGCVEGGSLGLIFEMAWHWGNLLDFCLGGNWMCAREGTRRFPGKNLRWTRARWYVVLLGWKMSNEPRLGDLDEA